VLTLLVPVINGVLPRPGGGKSAGAILERESGGKLENGTGIFVCPFVPANGTLYRVGILAKVVGIGRHSMALPGQDPASFLMVLLEGVSHARWNTVQFSQGSLQVEGLEPIDFSAMRSEYPVVSGAGWVVRGGYTEFRSLVDIPVTIYGNEIERNSMVELKANLKGLVSMETAHTIEHAMIRSLQTYGLCSARTLQESMRLETEELTWSVEKSMKFAMPEFLGQSQAGACGNPMTHLAQYYMFQEMSEQMKSSNETDISPDRARRVVMSKLTGDMGLTTEPGLRSLQGLKKGMRHDDSLISIELCKRVLSRFPLEPWQ